MYWHPNTVFNLLVIVFVQFLIIIKSPNQRYRDLLFLHDIGETSHKDQPAPEVVHLIFKNFKMAAVLKWLPLRANC